LVDFEHATHADLQVFDQSLCAAGTPTHRLVARDAAGTVVGYALHFQVPWTSRVGLHWCTVRVDPRFRQQGIGRALLAQVVRSVQAAGGAALLIATRAASTVALDACERFGFRAAFRSTEWRIDPTCFDPTPFRDVPAQLAAHGLTIATLPELQQHDADWLSKLHQLYITLSRDVPIPERATIGPAELAEFVSGLPNSLPEACFVAVAGQEYVGVSFMHRGLDAPVLYQKLTGVLAGWRGRGIALALKLRTLAYASAVGFQQISTWIESNNPAMLRLSQKLGFVEQPGGAVVLELNLAPFTPGGENSSAQ
jgi:GNAT superfamily N-acetyltransferase